MSDECARKGKWIGGCRFEPRYDKAAAAPPRFKFDSYRGDWKDLMEPFRAITYVADVCTTCGKVVKRENIGD